MEEKRKQKKIIFGRYGKYPVYNQIVNDNITEKDIWIKIPESKAGHKLKKQVKKIKEFYDIYDVEYRKIDGRYKDIFLPHPSIYPFYMEEKIIAICKVKNIFFNELLISLKDLIFINYNYEGNTIRVENIYGHKKLAHPKENLGVIVTDKSIELFNQIKADNKLNSSINRAFRKYHFDLHIGTRKKRLDFNELKKLLVMQNKNWSDFDRKYVKNEPERILGIVFSISLPSSLIYNIKINPELFEITKEIFEKIKNIVDG